MSAQQATLFVILLITMGLFVWGRWRYDLVALTALIVAVLARVVPAEQAFLGLGHPAVITVAMVLIISRALQASGVIERLGAVLTVATRHPLAHIAALTALGAALSGFMNNVGALALLMPVALQTSAATGRSPALLLMPLAFGSILGGLMTLMGTPPNIIIAAYREEVFGASFAVFDFAPVGVTLAVVGVLFITFVGWRLIPAERRGKRAPEDLFEVKDYIFEVRVPKDAPVIGKGLRHLEVLSGDEVLGVGILRDDEVIPGPRYARLREDDIAVLEADPSALRKVVEAGGLELVGEQAFTTDDLRSEDVGLIEAVITPTSRLVGRTFKGLRLGARYECNLIALARQGKPFKRRLDRVSFEAGDVVLLQGQRDDLIETVVELGCLPLPERGLQIGKRPRAAVSVLVFAIALGVAIAGLLPIYVAFGAAVIVLVVSEVISLREAYAAVDWPVIILLGAMIPLGRALESTGGTELIAGGIVRVAGDMGPVTIMAILLAVTMTLSDVMNNAATAVVMAPIAATLALELGVNVDPFLMAVAVGASCAFLTPIGHQNNVLVMGPAGYRFGDYWRMGLPLELIIIALGIPLIALVWPL